MDEKLIVIFCRNQCHGAVARLPGPDKVRRVLYIAVIYNLQQKGPGELWPLAPGSREEGQGGGGGGRRRGVLSLSHHDVIHTRCLKCHQLTI